MNTNISSSRCRRSPRRTGSTVFNCCLRATQSAPSPANLSIIPWPTTSLARQPQCADRKSEHDTGNTLSTAYSQHTHDARSWACSFRVLFFFCLFVGWGFGWCCCCGTNESMESVQSSLQCTDHLHSHAEQVSPLVSRQASELQTLNIIRSAWRRFVWKKLYFISPLILKLSPSDTISAVCAMANQLHVRRVFRVHSNVFL